MKSIQLPTRYASLLDLRSTERAISFIKDRFPKHLAHALHLQPVSAPVFVERHTGLQDDLNGVETPVSFAGPDGKTLEIVHSLAKWKRHRLSELQIPAGEGLLTDMRALRPCEEPGPLHSIYVDQWDWEQSMRVEDRSLAFLKATVRKIYQSMRLMEADVFEYFPQLVPSLPEEIAFIHTEDLVARYPEATPKEREAMVAKEHGAVFLIGIGGKLTDGKAHDGRAPDYDDWSTPTGAGRRGLNGDILFWHPELEIPFEVSSMGIRVDKAALLAQLAIRQAEERIEYDFHRKLIAGKLPQSIGGGIGQSRLCMFLLRKVHIGEVQASVWPEAVQASCREKGIPIL